ncbi:hypothetical protein GALL_125090 [mine drainage metagenome]|uniref:DUF4270 domain-containing protein n=1 Tax=mine drainage metagenome TaxID=410659 RepID=A0A1J5SAC2_9ZZZZ
MIKKLFPILLVTASVFFFASCTKPDIQFGQELLNISNTQIVMIDTFAPKLSTVYVDSFVTSGKGIGLTGGYTDPLFGKISSQTFLELTPPPYVKNNTGSANATYDNTIYDSLTLIIKLKKGNYYGDTTKTIQINVHRLSQLITPPNYGSLLYNIDTTAVYPTPLGSGTFTIYPARTDTLAVRLNDNLGHELYNKLKNTNDVDVQSAANFLQYFKGLRISSPALSNLAIGIKDSVIMRMYYRKFGMYVFNEHTDFTLSNTSHQYNNITVDRTGKPLAGISSANREILSESTGNKAYLQSITGSIVKITFPSMFDIKQLPSFAKLMNVKLIIRPMQNSYQFYALPPLLRLSVTTTAANTIGNDISAVSANGGAAAQTGNLSFDFLNGLNTNYSYDLTAYFKSMLNSNTTFYPGDHNGLLLSPPVGAFESSFNRVIVGNNGNILGRLELQVSYAAVQ